MLPKIKTIIYACDLENQTQSAVELVLNLANLHQAKVIFLHVIEPINSQTANMISGYVAEEVMATMRENGKKEMKIRMETMLADLMEKHADELANLATKPEILIESGIPTDSIHHVAKEKEADLIVMNSRTHSLLGQMMLGSTANRVIHSSDTPVLVVPIK
ncbi:universal stress protein [Marinomonas ushuaiensis DSM 15871]|uniref:Universal stress protein n=1 Tax=Marinomonas ushuaiensis DSM 15871 TaxID=1122207 RepID=X7E6H7_9GAMM|nr:universal stress protein [Marinomonas ushuaiensis]ETX10786.1 universal stress protein [Marinomonas ushuaiensis DSM 15871]